MPDFAVLQRPWKVELSRLLNEAESEVLISSPYVSSRGAAFVVENISPSVRATGQLTLLTNLSTMNVTQGATDPNAVQALAATAANVRIHHLPRLHAKVYIGDSQKAIVTSGNLTYGGLSANYEYGLYLEHLQTVERVRRDIIDYASLGVSVEPAQLAAYSQAAENVRTALRDQQRELSNAARRSFEEALRKAGDELIKLRVAEGSLHGILGRTVVYLLGREGPLATQDLHPLVQAIHPDLCDDSVDRVIAGVRFGKKWKHAVRTAQQQLKRNGLIELDSGFWKLTT